MTNDFDTLYNLNIPADLKHSIQGLYNCALNDHEINDNEETDTFESHFEEIIGAIIRDRESGKTFAEMEKIPYKKWSDKNQYYSRSYLAKLYKKYKDYDFAEAERKREQKERKFRNKELHCELLLKRIIKACEEMSKTDEGCNFEEQLKDNLSKSDFGDVFTVNYISALNEAITNIELDIAAIKKSNLFNMLKLSDLMQKLNSDYLNLKKRMAWMLITMKQEGKYNGSDK